jgi:sugar lactone lactonase YvrE
VEIRQSDSLLLAVLVSSLSVPLLAQAIRPPQAAGIPNVRQTTPLQTGPSGIIYTVAGDGYVGDNGNGGPATLAQLIHPQSVAADKQGNLYIADPDSQVVRKVTVSTGIISVYAGTGFGGYSGDKGPAASADLDEPIGVAVDSKGNLYIADEHNNAIRKVDALSGIITTVAGNGAVEPPGGEDSCGPAVGGGLATKTTLCEPHAVAVDAQENLYIAQPNLNVVLEVNAATGKIGTVAGNGVSGYSGDGGPAVKASLNGPNGVAVDAQGNVYIADTLNCTIRKVTASTGLISSLVGKSAPYGAVACGLRDFLPAANAEISYPEGVAVDGQGNIFIADTQNAIVRMIAANGGYIWTVAGSYIDDDGFVEVTPGYSGDGGPADYGTMNDPEGLSLDSLGNLFVAEPGNSVIRKITDASVFFSEAPEFFSPTPGVVTSPVTVTLASPVEGATIYYTTDGTLPTTSSTKYTAPFAVGELAVVSAFSTLPSGPNTTVALGDYLYAPTPVIFPGAGTVTKGTKVTITDGNPAAKIYYTVDGSNPTIGGSTVQTYAGPITISNVTAVKSAALTSAHGPGGYEFSGWSGIASAIYSLPVVATPTFTPPAGEYASAQSVTIADATPGATIYYTTDGTNPTTSSTRYTNAITVTAKTETIQAIAVLAGYTTCAVTAATYDIAQSVGTTSGDQTVTVPLANSFTLGSISVLTQGTPNLDFNLAAGGTCAVGTAYTAGQSCTVKYTFKPTVPGTRMGAVSLYDKTSSPPVLQATGYIDGIGTGPLVGFFPGVQTVVANAANNGVSGPYGVAADGAGNIYIADTNNGRVLKETLSADGYTQTVVANHANNGLSAPNGVAVDGAGNVYIADTDNSRVLKETLSAGSYSQTVVATYAINGLEEPYGVAVDAAGNVYISDAEYYDSQVLKETLSPDGYVQTDVAEFASNGLNNPFGIAVDAAGNVYVVNSYNYSVLKETLSDGGYTQSVIANVANNGLYSPQGVAVDGVGNVYIADAGNNRVLKETLSAGSYTQSVLPSAASDGLSAPSALVVDGVGNVYIADTNNSRVLKEDYADAPSLTFAATAVGSTSSDSPQTVSLWNDGNEPLTLPVPASGDNPSISNSFTLNRTGASACPLVTHTSLKAGTLAAGASCLLPISFTPTTTGAIAGSLTLTDNNLDVTKASQRISLSGTGTTSTAVK